MVDESHNQTKSKVKRTVKMEIFCYQQYELESSTPMMQII